MRCVGEWIPLRPKIGLDSGVDRRPPLNTSQDRKVGQDKGHTIASRGCNEAGQRGKVKVHNMIRLPIATNNKTWLFPSNPGGLPLMYISLFPDKRHLTFSPSISRILSFFHSSSLFFFPTGLGSSFFHHVVQRFCHSHSPLLRLRCAESKAICPQCPKSRWWQIKRPLPRCLPAKLHIVRFLGCQVDCESRCRRVQCLGQ